MVQGGWKKATGYGAVTYKYHKNYSLEFQNETFRRTCLDFIVAEDCIEFSGWLGDKEHKYGRIAFQFEPKTDDS